MRESPVLSATQQVDGLGGDQQWDVGFAESALELPCVLGNVEITQDSTGSRAISLPTAGTCYRFPGGTQPVLSTTGNSVDIMTIVAKSATVADVTFSKAFQ